MTSPDPIAEIVAATRAAQGLPPTVEDPATLDRVARLLASAAGREPASRLGHADLAPLVDELVRRFSSGHEPVRITTPALTDAGRARLADLLGLDRLPVTGARLGVDRLAGSLGVDGALGLRAVLVELRGPLGDRRAEREERAAVRRRLWDEVAADAERLAIFSDRGRVAVWVERLAAAGVPNGDVDGHRNRLAVAVECLGRLPLTKPTSLAAFAAESTGTAHGLDPGRRLTRIVLDALSIAFDVPGATEAEAVRAMWERAGVIPDPLSSTVLTLGLRPAGDAPLARFLRSAAEQREPVVLTLRQIQRWPVDARLQGGTVFVVENPSLLADAADGWSGPPLLCSSGRPSLAVVTLVRHLRDAGATVYQHADFDAAGLAITRWLADRAGTTPWQMDATAYENALAARRPSLDFDDGAGDVGETPWDPALATSMRRHRRVIHEEAVAGELLARMAASVRS